jgi:hypothetical protein
MVSGLWLQSSGATGSRVGRGNRRLPQSAMVSASVGCLRREAALGLPRAPACSERQLLSPAGGRTVPAGPGRGAVRPSAAGLPDDRLPSR